jgi:nitrite reductase/ring-hydroxylating ferredoxin subunit
MSRQVVALVSEVEPGRCKIVTARGREIGLFNVGGEIFAVNHVCPHRGGPLGEGRIAGTVVTCPWHGWTFDVRTGRPDHPGGHTVATYQVKVDDTTIYVGWLRP